ncbi:predicted protein [Sclerotinia sclerotiorum 1980 UF-70]|uniref:Uncharacterized protein n=1 Tax=Sclerotinia sclerotiorum (strain ATCC 18683 / 1980 / Ss-1) TaxID=665079 RepID=A7F3X5_SCLS1|nr:predicted protein [Sclerotinia sclerotiorum 1980 UF-70]EDN97446.1 predicted protein [Sclerotinia sclerotiorum 1980 UF-70]
MEFENYHTEQCCIPAMLVAHLMTIYSKGFLFCLESTTSKAFYIISLYFTLLYFIHDDSQIPKESSAVEEAGADRIPVEGIAHK